MSAELLRRAASLMRERVQHIKAESGLMPTAPASSVPWFEAVDDYRGLGDPDHVHIASWSPATADAVADLLEAIARGMNPDHRTLNSAALAVARAYLGETT